MMLATKTILQSGLYISSSLDLWINHSSSAKALLLTDLYPHRWKGCTYMTEPTHLMVGTWDMPMSTALMVPPRLSTPPMECERHTPSFAVFFGAERSLKVGPSDSSGIGCQRCCVTAGTGGSPSVSPLQCPFSNDRILLIMDMRGGEVVPLQ
ncbi:hypothetical protein EDC04DRAFT_165513 [Pisolithus marmoratus]|nr:hypothetical protein EDC04DRAFT_165513 [Pisolithus marmoratus]